MIRWYVGCKNGKRTAFSSTVLPTEETHGALYTSVIGPFRTRRAAVWATAYGVHFDAIAEAERCAKAEKG